MGFFSIFDDRPHRRATDKTLLEHVASVLQWLLSYVGVAALAILLFVGAGKWTGRYEIVVIKEKVPVPKTVDCGSCRKGNNTLKGTKK